MPTILVIDDEESVRLPLSDLLRFDGFDVLEAKDGKSGVEMATEEVPDLIICDIMMPGMDGFEVLEALRKFSFMAMTPFIFLTARIDPADTERGLNLGADDYVCKPFEPTQLIERIRSRLGKYRIMKDSLNEVRSNLIGKVPHEFKTPLNGILGFASMMKENAHMLNSGEVRDFSSLILESGERMLQTVVNYVRYLELQIDLGQDEIPGKYCDTHCHFEVVDMDRVLGRLFNQFPERKNDVDRFIQPVGLALEGDDLEYMVYQLVENALKFSRSASRVSISTVVDADSYVLSVADRGQGMSNDQISKLGPFIQLNREEQEQQGLGLGLSVVDSICRLYGGSISITGQPGDGTRVILKLPIYSE
jgi:two-component system, sensor histidine kinase and response regulator